MPSQALVVDPTWSRPHPCPCCPSATPREGMEQIPSSGGKGGWNSWGLLLSQNHRIPQVGRDTPGWSNPAPGPAQLCHSLGAIPHFPGKSIFGKGKTHSISTGKTTLGFSPSFFFPPLSLISSLFFPKMGKISLSPCQTNFFFLLSSFWCLGLFSGIIPEIESSCSPATPGSPWNVKCARGKEHH